VAHAESSTPEPSPSCGRHASPPAPGRAHHADNLDFLQALHPESADFVYLDPPYFTGRRRSRPAASRSFPDTWSGGLDQYLVFLEPRLAACSRLLKPTASICAHLDWHAAHYVKVLMDRVLGPENFLNEIIWSYRTGGTSSRWFPRKHDTLLIYARCLGRHTFHPIRAGSYRTDGLNRDEDGKPYKNTRRGRLYFDARGPLVTDVWEIPFLSTVSDERTGYPTQKPVALLRRLLLAFTNPDDLVIDPFCGSGTTLVAAAQLSRRAVGCDIIPGAVRLSNQRLDALKTPRSDQATR
jgi:site-specific DNA-methyltransferase (adenine-specific)